MKMLVIMIGLVFTSLYAQENAGATVSFVVGKVSIKSTEDNKWKPLKKDDQVDNGDTIMTGNGSATTFLYKGSEFKILANSTLVVNSLYSKDKEGSVEVKNGSAVYSFFIKIPYFPYLSSFMIPDAVQPLGV